MKLSRVLGALLASTFLVVCFLLAESGGAPAQAIGNPNMCVQSGCHESFRLNQNANLLTVTGFPATYNPGTTYDVTVSVGNNPTVSPSRALAGFAAFVNKDGTPFTASVGTLTAADPGTRLAPYTDGRVQITYVTHNAPRPGSPAANFTFRWTAPLTDSGSVVLVVGSNSANGDGTHTGDFISKQTFTAQAGAASCTFAINPASQSFAASGGTGDINVAANADCSWTATSNSGFIDITNGASGTGNGAVRYSVAANTSLDSRTGILTVAGQTFTVTQAGAQPENEKLFFAQFGDGQLQSGQKFASILIAMNGSTSQTASGTVKLFDPDGDPLSLSINGTQVNGSFRFDIPPQGIRFFASDAAGPLVTGSVQVTSTIPIVGTILFASGIGTTGVAGTQPLARFMVPIESDGAAGVDIGVAASNPTSSLVDVMLILRDSDGKPVANGNAVVLLAPNGQLAQFAREIFKDRGIDFSRFRGSLEVNSPVPINGMAIRVSPGQFTTLPVAAIN
ncbi:MAG: hypothetical protein HY644_03185 [Acidobacteria bacterium]|nr:hypothetical protein [Acidobacteriota bacterium]